LLLLNPINSTQLIINWYHLLLLGLYNKKSNWNMKKEWWMKRSHVQMGSTGALRIDSEQSPERWGSQLWVWLRLQDMTSMCMTLGTKTSHMILAVLSKDWPKHPYSGRKWMLLEICWVNLKAIVLWLYNLLAEEDWWVLMTDWQGGLGVLPCLLTSRRGPAGQAMCHCLPRRTLGPMCLEESFVGQPGQGDHHGGILPCSQGRFLPNKHPQQLLWRKLPWLAGQIRPRMWVLLLPPRPIPPLAKDRHLPHPLGDAVCSVQCHVLLNNRAGTSQTPPFM
jgi:hypothetical protein